MKKNASLSTWIVGLGIFFSINLLGSPTKDTATYLLPFNCSELLPDNSAFLSFFESIARGQVVANKALSKKIFKVLALRDKLNQKPELFQGSNPLDALIARTLCYYREQKDALQIVPYYDPKLLEFLSQNIKDLEKKAEAVILDLQVQILNKEELGRRARQNEALVAAERESAEQSANRMFDQIAQEAQRKAKGK